MTDTPTTDARDDAPADPHAAPTSAGRSRKLFRALMAILILALLAGGVWVTCHALYPGYTATALLQIAPPSTIIDGKKVTWCFDLSSDENAATHAKLIAMPEVLDRALAMTEDPDGELDINVPALAWYQEDPTTAQARLAEMLEVAPLKDTALIAVNVTARKPATAVMLANAIARAYVLDSRDSTELLYRKHLERLEARKADVEVQIAETQEEMGQLVGQAPTPDDELQNTIQQKKSLYRELKGQLETAEEEWEVELLMHDLEILDGEILDMESSLRQNDFGQMQLDVVEQRNRQLREELDKIDREITKTHGRIENEQPVRLKTPATLPED